MLLSVYEDIMTLHHPIPFLVKRKTINHLPRLQALEKKKKDSLKTYTLFYVDDESQGI